MSLLHRFRKDTNNAILTGISAGLARGLNVDRKWVRVALLVCLLVMPIPTLILYIIAAVMLPPKSKWLD